MEHFLARVTKQIDGAGDRAGHARGAATQLSQQLGKSDYLEIAHILTQAGRGKADNLGYFREKTDNKDQLHSKTNPLLQLHIYMQDTQFKI